MPATQDSEASGLYSQIPLPSEWKGFRVLDLLPGRTEDDLRARIRILCVDFVSRYYEALSYTWGSNSEARSILINDKYRLTITNNLFRALRAMRKTKSVRTIWVDSLCIDQSNLIERGQQVAVMDYIYMNAHCVNVWLGELLETREIPQMSFLRKIQWLTFGPPGKVGPFSEFRAVLAACRNRHVDLEEAIRNSDPPWHSRAWIIQEFALARRLYLWCGSKRMKYDSWMFRDLCFVTRCHYHKNLTNLDLLQGKLQSIGFQWNRDAPFETDICSLIRTLDSSAALDSRNRVYALRSLMLAKERNFISVDYSLTCAEVFAQATFASIKATFDFRLLCFVNTIALRSENLPTWAVDFTFSPRGGRGLHTVIRGFETHDQITKDTYQLAYGDARLRLMDNYRLLKFAGMTFDVIETVVDIFGEHSGPPTAGRGPPYNAIKVPGQKIQQVREQVSLLATDPAMKPAALDFISTLGSRLDTVDEQSYGKSIYNTIVLTLDRPVLLDARIEDILVKHTMEEYYNNRSVDLLGLFATSIGAVGIVPRTVETGDLLVCVPGFGCLLILRPPTLAEHPYYTFRGLAFVHGLHPGVYWQQCEYFGGSKASKVEDFVVC